MTNLLPPSEQRAVWGTYRARFIIAASLLLLLFALLAGIALAPSYLAIELAAPPAPTATTTPRQTDDAIAITRAQTVVRALQPLLASATTSTDVVRAAISLKPAGVVIRHVTVISGDTAQMTISGTASRDKVSAYRDALGKDPHFTSVSVPVNALVGADNGAFSVTLTGNF